MLRSLANRPARFARAGKIKLGVKVQGKGRDGRPVEIPKDVDYLVLPEELRAVYGAQPKTIPIRFPYDDPELVFDGSRQKWQGADLTIRCDEQTCWARDHETGKVTETPCKLEDPMGACPCGAEPMGRLLVLVPGGHLGVYEVRLRGYTRIAALWEELRQYHQTFGRLTQLPFFLTRKSRMSTYRDKDGKAHTREIHPVSVVCEWSTLEQFAAERQALPAAQVVVEALPAASAPEPDDDAGGDGAEGAGREQPLGVAVPEEVPREMRMVGQEAALAPGSQGEALLGPQKEVEHFPRNDWDVSRLILEATKVLNMPAVTYRQYLKAAFPGGEDCMDDLQILEARATLEKAGRSPKIAQALAAAIKRKAGERAVAR